MGDQETCTRRLHRAATTNANGEDTFSGLPPGDYTVVETNPPGYPENVKDEDTTPDGDTGDSNTTVDNVISVTLVAGETDNGNSICRRSTTVSPGGRPENVYSPFAFVVAA